MFFSSQKCCENIPCRESHACLKEFQNHNTTSTLIVTLSKQEEEAQRSTAQHSTANVFEHEEGHLTLKIVPPTVSYCSRMYFICPRTFAISLCVMAVLMMHNCDRKGVSWVELSWIDWLETSIFHWLIQTSNQRFLPPISYCIVLVRDEWSKMVSMDVFKVSHINVLYRCRCECAKLWWIGVLWCVTVCCVIFWQGWWYAYETCRDMTWHDMTLKVTCYCLHCVPVYRQSVKTNWALSQTVAIEKILTSR